MRRIGENRSASVHLSTCAPEAQELAICSPSESKYMIEVHNKIDQWEADHREHYAAPAGAIPLSAITGEGCDALLAHIDESLSQKLLGSYNFTLPTSDGRAIAWLHAHGQVASQRMEENDEARATYQVRLSPANAARFVREFGY